MITVRRLSVMAASLSGVCLLFMGFLGVADIIGTHFLGRPIPGGVEITKALMVCVIMLGMALAEAQGRHIRVGVVAEHLPRRLQGPLEVLSHFAMAVMFAAIAWFGWDAFWGSIVRYEYDEGLIQVPLWPARLLLALGATLMTVQASLLAYARLAGKQVPGQPAETADASQPPI